MSVYLVVYIEAINKYSTYRWRKYTIGLCESSYSKLEYSVEYLIKLSSTGIRLILEVSVNCLIYQPSYCIS